MVFIWRYNELMKKLIYILFLLPLSISAFPPVTHGIVASQISQCDADAQKYIDSAGITNATEKTAICNCVKQLKDSSLWTSMKAVYPLLGRSSSACKWNLKDIRQNDAAYRLSFFGGITFDSLGITGNGANSYANTSFIPAYNFDSIQGNSFGAVIVNNIDAVQLPMGIRPSGSGNALSFSTRISNIAYSGNVGAQLSVTNTDARGVYISTRTNRSTSKFFRNGTLLINNGAYVPDAYTTPIYLLARNHINNPEFIITNTIGFAFIGSALTDAQASTLYNIINTFKNTLGR